MKLLERYALMTGLQIGDQDMLEQFYALPFTRYITLHAGSGMPGKNYPFFTEVINLIKPYLVAANIEVVQLGVKEDVAIPGCHHTMGKTTKHQANYLVSRTLLHLSNDSIWSHRVGHLGLPLVETFSTTSVENHSPFQFNEAKTRFISSHRWGKNPTFASQESPSTAMLIDPFLVAKSVLDLLSIPHSIVQRTLHVGQAYNATLFELIPNVVPSPQFNPEMPLAVRMDIEHNEQILAATLQTGRKVNLVLKAPINLQLITAFRASIQSFNYEIDESTPLDYVKSIKKTLQNLTFFSRTADLDELSRIRFKFFDIINVQHIPNKTRADFERESSEYQNTSLDEAKKGLDSFLKDGRLRFRTNKFVLSQGKTYLSLAHSAADIPMEGDKRDGVVLDSAEWFRDINHYLVYE
jgi:hypothetical protein